MGQPVTQWQILSPDSEGQSRFYADLFQWTITSTGPLGYRMADTGSERGIPGGFWPAPAQAKPFVQLFVEVEDMAATIEQATALGATVGIPPQELPGGEAMAVLRDPAGMSFGIYRPAKL